MLLRWPEHGEHGTDGDLAVGAYVPGHVVEEETSVLPTLASALKTLLCRNEE